MRVTRTNAGVPETVAAFPVVVQNIDDIDDDDVERLAVASQAYANDSRGNNSHAPFALVTVRNVLDEEMFADISSRMLGTSFVDRFRPVGSYLSLMVVWDTDGASLQLISCSCGPFHGAFVAQMVCDAETWCSAHTSDAFTTRTDAKDSFGKMSKAPDVVVGYQLGCAMNTTSPCLVIEVEVNNRDVPALRTLAREYLTRRCNVQSVLGIKVYQSRQWHAAAALWKRTSTGVEMHRFWDFGKEPLNDAEKTSGCSTGQAEILECNASADITLPVANGQMGARGHTS
ncbi:hypothetical protein AB1Y20_012697 [Prymnesium parvum]|uniref:Uncharacterized protein n=1 Tax=Prymnesium parvum TaxID=97485 RepID=A0AB34IJE4_PRYPA